MLFPKTLAFVMLFLFDILSFIKHESYIPGSVVFGKDFTFETFLCGSLLFRIYTKKYIQRNMFFFQSFHSKLLVISIHALSTE